MEDTAKDTVTQVLGQLLRQPEAPREVEVERALMRLQAARPDAAYLLLHRVLVLETALDQLRQRSGRPVAASKSAGQPGRNFLRDAAVVTMGVVAGQALFDGVSDLTPDIGGDMPDFDGWL